MHERNRHNGPMELLSSNHPFFGSSPERKEEFTMTIIERDPKSTIRVIRVIRALFLFPPPLG